MWLRYHLLGDLYLENGESDKALAVWEDATSARPTRPIKPGGVQQSRHRLRGAGTARDDAITAFKSAVAADPKFVEAWFTSATAYLAGRATTRRRATPSRSASRTPAPMRAAGMGGQGAEASRYAAVRKKGNPWETQSPGGSRWRSSAWPRGRWPGSPCAACRIGAGPSARRSACCWWAIGPG